MRQIRYKIIHKIHLRGGNGHNDAHQGWWLRENRQHKLNLWVTRGAGSQFCNENFHPRGHEKNGIVGLKVEDICLKVWTLNVSLESVCMVFNMFFLSRIVPIRREKMRGFLSWRGTFRLTGILDPLQTWSQADRREHPSFADGTFIETSLPAKCWAERKSRKSWIRLFWVKVGFRISAHRHIQQTWSLGWRDWNYFTWDLQRLQKE